MQCRLLYSFACHEGILQDARSDPARVEAVASRARCRGCSAMLGLSCADVLQVGWRMILSASRLMQAIRHRQRCHSRESEAACISEEVLCECVVDSPKASITARAGAQGGAVVETGRTQLQQECEAKTQNRRVPKGTWWFVLWYVRDLSAHVVCCSGQDHRIADVSGRLLLWACR